MATVASDLTSLQLIHIPVRAANIHQSALLRLSGPPSKAFHTIFALPHFPRSLEDSPEGVSGAAKPQSAIPANLDTLVALSLA